MARARRCHSSFPGTARFLVTGWPDSERRNRADVPQARHYRGASALRHRVQGSESDEEYQSANEEMHTDGSDGMSDSGLRGMRAPAVGLDEFPYKFGWLQGTRNFFKGTNN